MLELDWDELRQHTRPEQAPSDGSIRDADAAWRDALTLVLTAVAFLSVVWSVESANWVRDLPSLYPIGLSALVVGYGLSRVRRNQIILLPAGLLLGASILFLQLMAIISGHSVYVRTDALLDRMYVWWSSVTQDGISTDPLPVIVIMLVMTWFGSFFAAWAIFRWRNPILGLIPGAAALIWDAAFSTSEFNIAAVVYIFAGVLLTMRMSVARRERRWERDGLPYPRFISVSVLHATFWMTVILLGGALLIPIGGRSQSANARWDLVTNPIRHHLKPIARAFAAINPEKAVKIHNLKDLLGLQGKIAQTDAPAVHITGVIGPEVAPFLREQSFDQYTRDGWKANSDNSIPLAAGEHTQTDNGSAPEASESALATLPPRDVITIETKVQGGNADHLFSIGQPLQADVPASISVGAAAADIMNLSPASDLDNGDRYSVTGSVSVPSVEQMRAAGAAYPSWVTERYLQLPRRLPGRVRERAREIADSTATPYDATAAIEQYLRTFPVDYNVPAAPRGQDNVDYFLFDAQRGYFDYHASAMAVLLRTLGIPARVATGYVIDPAQRQGESDQFNLTQQQAFSWPEVYFPGIGWVEFNPTPSEPLIDRPETSAAAVRRTGQLPSADLGIQPTGPAAAPSTGSEGVTPRTWLMLGFVGVAATALLLGVGAKFAWDFGLRGLPLPVQLWEKSLRLATLADRPPRRDETPREFADRIRRDVPGLDGITDIATAYERVRFGQRLPSSEETVRINAAWASARTRLLAHALRRRPRPAR